LWRSPRGKHKRYLSTKKEEENVTKTLLVKNACPICGGDVKGNDEIKYYCKNCNLLFSRENLATNTGQEQQ